MPACAIPGFAHSKKARRCRSCCKSIVSRLFRSHKRSFNGAARRLLPLKSQIQIQRNGIPNTCSRVIWRHSQTLERRGPIKLGDRSSGTCKFNKLPTRQLQFGHKSTTVRQSVGHCQDIFLKIEKICTLSIDDRSLDFAVSVTVQVIGSHRVQCDQHDILGFQDGRGIFVLAGRFAGRYRQYRNRTNTYPKCSPGNLSVERQLAANWLLHVGYVGSHGSHGLDTWELNPAVYIPGSSLPTNSRRLFPGLGNITDLVHDVNSSYNGLQISAPRRIRRGFSILANYTLSSPRRRTTCLKAQR